MAVSLGCGPSAATLSKDQAGGSSDVEARMGPIASVEHNQPGAGKLGTFGGVLPRVF